MKKVDLHIHTTFSDGTLTPEEVVRVAHKHGLSAIAIADHDEVSGFSPAYETGKELGVDVIPAVELSAKRDNKSIHILGYFIEPTHHELLVFLRVMKQTRLDRAEKIVHKLQEQDISIEVSEIEKQAGVGVICRPHIAEVLVKKRIVSDLKEAFTKYIGFDKPCYVPKSNIPTKPVIDLIRKVGGIPVLAHPSSVVGEKWIEELVAEGIMGIEVWYPEHSEADISQYLEIAKKYKLIPTGGSDSHGTRGRYPAPGEFWVQYRVLDKLIHTHRKMSL